MLRGTYTAIVTPFTRDGAIDYARLRELNDLQVAGGVDGVAPVGSTGESATLSMDEHRHVIDATIESCAGRIAVLAGTGANATCEAVELTRHAQQSGADATLQVTPYYNRPSQEGLYRHFCDVADIGLPVILYNVPGRSGREIEVATIARLAAHPNVVAVKEAGGSVDRVSRILDSCEITVLSGDDNLTLPMMAVGAQGVISVASNLVPAPVTRMTHLALEGCWAEALAIHRRYYRLFSSLFLDTNPVPVKAAMAMLGLVDEVYRLPLCSMDEGLKERLRESLEGVELL